MRAVPAADPREPEDEGAATGRLPVRLPVLSATASAGTPLAAFHRALVAVGLGHYNLVRLSSVIPPGTEVGAGRLSGAQALPPAWQGARPRDFVDGRRGDRLYCVYAEARVDVPGRQAWAGVGWVQRTDGEGGYFVEHEATTPEAVLHGIRTSLADMVAVEAADFEPPQWVLEGVTCEDEPVCALVVVPYVAVPW